MNIKSTLKRKKATIIHDANNYFKRAYSARYSVFYSSDDMPIVEHHIFSFPFVLIIFPVHFSKYKWAEVYISAHFAFNVLVK